jgi:predicted PurR-regulated permease PerM
VSEEMADHKAPETENDEVTNDLQQETLSPQLVVLDPSWPSMRSIVRIVVITLTILFIAGFVENIIRAVAPLLFLIILSVFVAYFVDPLVRLIARPFQQNGLERLMPRSLAIVVAYAFLFLIIGGAVSFIAPKVGDQAREFGANLPSYSQAIRARGNDINRRFDRLRVPDEVQADLNKRVADLGSSITDSVGNFVLISVTYLPWFFLVPILSFFFLKDVKSFRLAVLRMFPAGRWRIRAESVLADVNTTLAAYTRAQLISCLIIATICTLGFYLIGLKFALLLGLLAGIFEFVPLLGPLTIGLIVVLIAAASDYPWNALYVAVFLGVLRLIHDYITYPRIVRGGIHLHPLAIILSVLVGEQVAGIPGVFISIPIVAIGTVILRHILEHQIQPVFVSGMTTEAGTPAEKEPA